MKWIIRIIGLIFILSGISILFDPGLLFNWLETNKDQTFLYTSAIVSRIVLGVLLIVSSKESRYPFLISLMGFLILIAGLLFILIGHSGFADFMTTVLGWLDPYTPLSGIIVSAFGGFLFYAFTGSN